ncbi:putative serine hydrolase (FSH1)-like protein [Phytophthora cinnamomi]|uniref:putative serine hydrolase (FSH1)-like protein n=1 Tax=Phytophthora cinnamomi TaxID=4785 RepID=UPI003559D007|nr:putative serine hydrolase (FSH1)-like protein [Phytophthora cinnamomi]
MVIVAENLPRPTALSPPPFESSKKIRVLCLHGFRTNRQVMLDQTRGIRAALGDAAEFVLLNGTYEARGTSDPMIESAYKSSAPFYEWFENQLADGSPLLYNDAESSAKARLQSGADKGEDHAWSLSYKGIEQSMVRIDEELRRHGPFDVVIGFSQGAALLTILTMWYLHHGNIRWWKLVICVGGVDVSGVNVKSLFLDKQGNRVPVPMPSIHLIGKTDPLYQESHRLALSWADKADPNNFKKWIYEHDGGHKFPSVSRNQKFYAELGRAIKKHCGKGSDVVCKL